VLTSVRSVFTQTDPIGVEVVVVFPGPGPGFSDADARSLQEELRLSHEREIREQRLSWIEAPTNHPARAFDRSALRNRGAAASRGIFLTFLDPGDTWLSGKLARLEPELRGHDLLVAARPTELQHPGAARDWVRALLRENFLAPGSLVVRRELFEKAGGFPEGYEGMPLPTRIPGDAEYELVLQCLRLLLPQSRDKNAEKSFSSGSRHSSTQSREASNSFRASERHRFQVLAEAGLAWVEKDSFLSAASPTLAPKLRRMRERVSLVQVGRKFPRRYWPTIAKRIFK
jgi:hypothetical protein